MGGKRDTSNAESLAILQELDGSIHAPTVMPQRSARTIQQSISRFEEKQPPEGVLVDDAIRNEVVRLRRDDGTYGDAVSKYEVIQEAQAQGKRLFQDEEDKEISLCRVCTVPMYNYQKKKERKGKAKAKCVKEFSMGLNIADHDIDIKCTQGQRLLTSGYPVQFTVRIRTHQMNDGHTLAKGIISRIAKKLLGVGRPRPLIVAKASVTQQFFAHMKSDSQI